MNINGQELNPLQEQLFILRGMGLSEIADEIYAAVLAGAEHAKPRWISVKDRLPENGVFVLVYIDLPWCYRIAALEYSEWIILGNGLTREVPTHWMPLPSAPEAEK